MHQQFLWVNYDKPQYLSSSDFSNEKIRNFAGYTWNPGKCSSALYTLMGDLWKGDRLILIGQYRDENERNPMVIQMRSRFDDMEYMGNIWYGATLQYENAGRLFTTSNINEDDEEGTHYIEPVFYRYVLNHTKHEYFYRYNLKSVNNWLNPLAFLLMNGKGRCGGKYGMWIGDELEVTNDKGKVKALGYEEMTRVYNYRYFTNQNPTDKDW
ncbi:MAG: hypothetical protein IJK53_09855 [Erysipelotrichaceae bacterium]|nr:hypothetical protein [Clostridia bacterium]MBQ6217672.1 hypothetical protein [Erysipelotrichaceae bacterium]